MIKSTHTFAPVVRLPSCVQAMWFARRPYEFLDRCQSRYGDVFSMTLGKRPGNVIVLSRPDHVAEAFRQPESNLCGASAISLVFEFMPPDSLVHMRGEEHRRGRGEMMQMLQEASKDQQDTVEQIVLQCVTPIAHGRLVDLRHVMNEVMARISCLYIYGSNLNDEQFVPLFDAVRKAVSSFATSFPVPRMFRMFGLNVDASHKEEMFATIRREIVKSLGDEPAEGAIGFARRRGSTLQSEATAVTELFSFLFGALISAGHHAMHHLLVEHDSRCMLAEAVRAPLLDDMIAEEKIGCFVKEVFRYSPSVPGPLRKVMRPCNVAGFDLEPGSIVLLCAYLAHRREDNFSDPHTFCPSRFESSALPSEAYFPFGNGLWRCPGARIGPAIVNQVIHYLLQNFDLEPNSPSYNPVALTTGGQTIRTKRLLARVTKFGS